MKRKSQLELDKMIEKFNILGSVDYRNFSGRYYQNESEIRTEWLEEKCLSLISDIFFEKPWIL